MWWWCWWKGGRKTKKNWFWLSHRKHIKFINIFVGVCLSLVRMLEWEMKIDFFFSKCIGICLSNFFSRMVDIKIYMQAKTMPSAVYSIHMRLLCNRKSRISSYFESPFHLSKQMSQLKRVSNSISGFLYSKRKHRKPCQLSHAILYCIFTISSFQWTGIAKNLLFANKRLNFI